MFLNTQLTVSAVQWIMQRFPRRKNNAEKPQPQATYKATEMIHVHVCLRTKWTDQTYCSRGLTGKSLITLRNFVLCKTYRKCFA